MTAPIRKDALVVSGYLRDAAAKAAAQPPLETPDDRLDRAFADHLAEPVQQTVLELVDPRLRSIVSNALKIAFRAGVIHGLQEGGAMGTRAFARLESALKGTPLS